MVANRSQQGDESAVLPSHPGKKQQRNTTRYKAADIIHEGSEICLNKCVYAVHIKTASITQMHSKQYTAMFTETSQQPHIISHATSKLSQAQIRTLYFCATVTTNTSPRDSIPTPAEANTYKTISVIHRRSWPSTETHDWESCTQTSYHHTQQLNRKLNLRLGTISYQIQTKFYLNYATQEQDSNFTLHK
ncbi:hypothetical protein F511_45946 [Dorcoceras hygrometricum]|uniref:Uncharacterized protein n=1 Tax=Dorcoceras hygrometricum TaxID=472368 RepID=A0A2Z6ZV93_9LAMI|nr:hypothetical protein F511_45946 [Dorcoceras hygrometricum]